MTFLLFKYHLRFDQLLVRVLGSVKILIQEKYLHNNFLVLGSD